MIYAPVKLITIGSDDGLSPGRRQAIIWTNAGTLLMSKILGEIHTLSFKEIIWKRCPEMAVFLSGPRCVKLPSVTSPRRVSLRRQVCNHCLPRRLSLWQPPAGPGVTSLPAHWRLGLRTLNCNECPNCLLSTCSSVHVSLSLFYVLDRHDMWLCIHNEWDICLDPRGQ